MPIWIRPPEMMSAVAATTSRIKLGQMCTAISYRNPVYLAKVAATADIISGARRHMGIGTVWYEHE
ncbi:LLM class flavin-dependent oxidoreductase, partial [Mycobacterium kyorinense]|uniref:LLM class flavin-dependent oxidoreductase n=1 Tax=Mycobacterium kyorinense TaxID=487514 RepID=UPI0012E79CB2